MQNMRLFQIILARLHVPLQPKRLHLNNKFLKQEKELIKLIKPRLRLHNPPHKVHHLHMEVLRENCVNWLTKLQQELQVLLILCQV
ncbi:MAG: hypothetical protein EB114_12310 [Betaproteobacteria bacterium]|nr:hypothetical protein [Betaproteobacteria bacterium]